MKKITILLIMLVSTQFLGAKNAQINVQLIKRGPTVIVYQQIDNNDNNWTCQPNRKIVIKEHVFSTSSLMRNCDTLIKLGIPSEVLGGLNKEKFMFSLESYSLKKENTELREKLLKAEINKKERNKRKKFLEILPIFLVVFLGIVVIVIVIIKTKK